MIAPSVVVTVVVVVVVVDAIAAPSRASSPAARGILPEEGRPAEPSESEIAASSAVSGRQCRSLPKAGGVTESTETVCAFEEARPVIICNLAGLSTYRPSL